MGLTLNQSVYKPKQKSIKTVAKRKLTERNKRFLRHLGLQLWTNHRKY